MTRNFFRKTNKVQTPANLSMGAQAVLAVLLLTIGTVEAAKGDVSFWRTEFTMYCPGGEHSKWVRDGKDLPNSGSNKSLTLTYGSNTTGRYYCQYYEGESTRKYYFYVEGKGCKNCIEVNAILLAVVIIADVIFTVFVIMTIYRCTKKKSPPAPVPHSSKATPRSGGRGPNVGAEYETLNQHTRGNDTYSKLNRTG